MLGIWLLIIASVIITVMMISFAVITIQQGQETILDRLDFLERRDMNDKLGALTNEDPETQNPNAKEH